MDDTTWEERTAYNKLRQANRDKRIEKMHSNLVAYGFERLSQYHYVIFGFIDFWPTKGKWHDRRRNYRGKYLKYLKKHIDKNYADLLKEVKNG